MDTAATADSATRPTRWWHRLDNGRVQCDVCPRACKLRHMDAANVDLKGFTEDSYHRVCAGRLAPVLETLEYLRHETTVRFEITNLLIPGANDSDQELDAMTRWGCHGCGERLIERDRYRLGAWNLTGDGRCRGCGARCAGLFDGPAGGWGSRRLPVVLRQRG